MSSGVEGTPSIVESPIMSGASAGSSEFTSGSESNGFSGDAPGGERVAAGVSPEVGFGAFHKNIYTSC